MENIIIDNVVDTPVEKPSYEKYFELWVDLNKKGHLEKEIDDIRRNMNDIYYKMDIEEKNKFWEMSSNFEKYGSVHIPQQHGKKKKKKR